MIEAVGHRKVEVNRFKYVIEAALDITEAVTWLISLTIH